MSYADDILQHYSFAPAALLKSLADALGEVENAAPAPQKKQTGGAKSDPLKDGARASESPRDFAKADTLLAMLEVSADTILCALAENTAKRENLGLGAARQLATERHPKVAARYLMEVRPDVALAEAADRIALSEGIPYSAALDKARADDPALAKRYVDDNFGGPAPAALADRPDVELAEKTKARAERDGVSYSKAMSLELAEDPALAKRYHERRLDGAAPEPSTKVKTPPGMRLVGERPDVQLAERVKARQERDGVGWSEAERLELSEDSALASRYADWKAGRTAIDEAAYRAETIRDASHGRLSRDKAFSAALAEDPQLRAGVGAYFEKTTRGK